MNVIDNEPLDPESPHEEFKRKIKASREAFQGQRDREQADLRFQVPEEQWDEDARKARTGGKVGSVETSARPILSISKLDQPIQLILNQARAAKLGVEIHPVSEKATKETAEVFQGIYQRIQRDSNADQARLWAFDRATKAGMGAYIVRTRWDDEAQANDPSNPAAFDQEISIERILYQDMVGFDPAAQRPDFSDGEYSWVGAWVPYETFKRLFPNAEYSTCEAGELADIASEEPLWFDGDSDNRSVLVVEYFYKVHAREVVTIKDWKGKEHTRERDVVTVRWVKLTAAEIIEEQDWNGKHLPVIPVLGRELQPYDNERRWVGMIGPAKDGQRFYNFAVSSLVERMALEPKAPWVMADGQDDGFQDEWKASNSRNIPVLHYRMKTLDGQPAPPPQRAVVDSQGMSLAMLAVQEADQFIQASTSVYDQSLGRARRDESGKRVLALQSQSDASTSHYLASLADISLAYEAKVILDLIPAIYDRPGRIARILGAEDDTRTVMLNAPFTMDAQGQPVRAASPQQPGAKVYDLKAGSYSISTNIGKSYQTRLQQGSDEIGQILASSPELMPILGATYFRFRDFPGAKEIADLLKKVRDKQYPDLEDEKDQPQTPEQLNARVRAVQGQAQQLQQQLKQATTFIQTDQMKQQATLAKAKLDNAAKVEIARMNHDAEQRDDQLEVMLEKMRVQAEATIQRMDQRFEAMQADLQRKHEERLQQMKAGHDVAMAAAAARRMEAQPDRGMEG